MKSFNLLFAVTLLFIVFGCSAYKPPKSYDVVNEMTYEKSFDEIWNAAIEWFATQGTPVKNLDKTSGFISTEYSLSTGQMDVLDCGEAGQEFTLVEMIEDYRGNFNLLIKQLPDDKVKVTVNVFFKATNNLYSEGRLIRSNIIDCVSIGILEEEILNYLGTH